MIIYGSGIRSAAADLFERGGSAATSPSTCIR